MARMHSTETPGVLRVKNWPEFQHYRRRNPPWIKLHRKLLDNREYQLLEDGAARLLFDIWLIASESDDGSLPFDSAALAWRLRKPVHDVSANLQALIRAGFILASGHDASTVLALCLHDATPEAETERETENSSSSAVEAEPVPEPAEARLAARLLTDADRTALSTALSTAASRTAAVAEIAMILDGGRPNVSSDPANVGLALCDYAANEHRWVNTLFRSYVQRTTRPPPAANAPPRRGGTGQRSHDNALKALEGM